MGSTVWSQTLQDIYSKLYSHHYKIAMDTLDAAAVDISDNTTFADLQNITEAVLDKMNVECKDGSCAHSEQLITEVMTKLDIKWKQLQVNGNDLITVLNLAFGNIYQKLDTSDSSPVATKSEEITSKTTFEQLVNISDDALASLIGDSPENGCTYLEKTKDDTGKRKKFYRNCLYHQKLALSDLPAVQIQLTKDKDPNNATICMEDLCNNKGLYTCMVCGGPNNICKLGELGHSKACASEEKYCIKELSGDSSNRELVARKCGTEFDREATCGSSGENIGIAAKGLVRCCSNREVSDCNVAVHMENCCLVMGILLLISLLGQ